MPVQTQGRGKVYFPDGAKVSIKAKDDVSYFDVGCINSAVEGVLNYDENQIETANCGKTQKQIKNMTIAGSFTLIDLDPEGVQKLSGGMFTLTSVAGTPSATVDNQVISAGADYLIVGRTILNAKNPIDVAKNLQIQSFGK